MTVAWPIGVYEGSHDITGTRIGEVNAFHAWSETPGAKIIDFQVGHATATWANIEGPTSLLSKISSWSAADKAKYELTVLPLPADKVSTLRQGATGAYNSHWTALGNNLATYGLQDIDLRWGHEFNGNWYRWSLGVNVKLTPDDAGGNPDAGAADGGASKFIDYYRHAYDSLRATGWRGEMVFCPNNGISGSGFLWEKAWPGDGYVGYFTMDSYDQSWAAGSYQGYYNSSTGQYQAYLPTDTDAKKMERQDIAWNEILNGSRGLAYARDFAISHGKKFGLSEWGIWKRTDGHGGEDDPRFISRIHAFLSAIPLQSIAHDSYFNHTDGGTSPAANHRLGPPTSTVFPESAAMYLSLWKPATTGGGGGATVPTPSPSPSIGTTTKRQKNKSRRWWG